jgi:hypothetical protein
MKIWNDYVKKFIDLEKCPVNKATWQHGFLTGFCIAFFIVIMLLMVVLP